MRGDVQSEGRFAHAGAGRNDDQLARLKTRGEPVKVEETRRNTGNQLFSLVEPLKQCDRMAAELAHRAEGGPYPPLRYLEDLMFGFVEELIDVGAGSLVTASGDSVAIEPRVRRTAFSRTILA